MSNTKATKQREHRKQAIKYSNESAGHCVRVTNKCDDVEFGKDTCGAGAVWPCAGCRVLVYMCSVTRGAKGSVQVLLLYCCCTFRNSNLNVEHARGVLRHLHIFS